MILSSSSMGTCTFGSVRWLIYTHIISDICDRFYELVEVICLEITVLIGQLSQEVSSVNTRRHSQCQNLCPGCSTDLICLSQISQVITKWWWENDLLYILTVLQFLSQYSIDSSICFERKIIASENLCKCCITIATNLLHKSPGNTHSPQQLLLPNVRTLLCLVYKQ